MKLKKKVLLASGLFWVAFFLVVFVIARFFLLHGFLTLEENHANHTLSRMDRALNQLDQAQYTFTTDWSAWDDLYAFMQGKNPHFMTNNLQSNALVNAHVNWLTYLNSHGKFIAEKAVDLETKKEVELPADWKSFLETHPSLLHQKSNSHGIKGYALVGNKVILIAATPITNAKKTSHALGTLVTGRVITPKVLLLLKNLTRENIELYTLQDIPRYNRLNDIFTTLQNTPNNHYLAPMNKQWLEAYTLVKDIEGNPIAVLRTTQPRAIYLTGLHTIHYFLTALFLLGVLFSGLMMWLFHRLIIRRLESMDQQLAFISARHAIDRRVQVEGADELSYVASAVNSFLDMIQVSQTQLEKRIEERTTALQVATDKLEDEMTQRQSIEKELVSNKEHLVRLAHYDPLTSLPNRVFFSEILNKTLNHAEKLHKKLGILFIDLDRFKTINDALGHSIGNIILKEMAKRYEAVLRSGDMIARLGGDEFIVLVNNVQHTKILNHVAEKLLQVTADPIALEQHEFVLTASIGICIFPEDGKSIEDLQRHADMAMYHAKRLGGNRYQYYTQEMNAALHEQIKLESALRKALQQNEFTLYFQPKVNLEDENIVGIEALLRWESPELGIVKPSRFIRLAEETGLILPIGEWVLREACKINKKWQESGFAPIKIAVNVSAKQFQHRDIVTLITSVLKETGLDPRYLELEITESAMLDNANEAIKTLKAIKALGVSLTIDDFGTGYTSIQFLKDLPVSTVKIDKRFIKGLKRHQDDAALTRAMIAMAHNLGLSVIAEGVETLEQVQFLSAEKCDMIQGYYISRPVPAKKVSLQLAKFQRAKDQMKLELIDTEKTL